MVERRRTGLTQREAAASLGQAVRRYRAMEAETGPEEFEVETGELCMLLRRRHGETQAQTASRFGVSRLWLASMENGRVAADRLAAWWTGEEYDRTQNRLGDRISSEIQAGGTVDTVKQEA